MGTQQYKRQLEHQGMTRTGKQEPEETILTEEMLMKAWTLTRTEALTAKKPTTAEMPTTARTPRNVGNTSCSIKGVNSIRDSDNSRDNSGNKGSVE
jgi:hypothetical protein